MRSIALPRAGVLDRLDLLILRLAKRGRRRFTDLSAYDDFFDEHDVAEYVKDARNLWRFGVVRRELDRLHPSGAGRVLDVGCGLGVALDHLPAATVYLGFDSSEATLATARRLHPGREERFRQGAFPRLPAESSAWDVVLCLEVLEHLPDDAQALADLGRVLEPGGYLFLSVPSTRYWPAYRQLIGHYRHYSAAALTELLGEHGFEVMRRFPQHRTLWRAYYYFYLCLRVTEAIVRKAGARTYSLYDSAPYRWVSSLVLRAIARRQDLEDPTSTFVLCRKAASRP